MSRLVSAWLFTLCGLAALAGERVTLALYPPPLKRVATVVRPNTNRFSFMVTATDSYGLTSDPSASVSLPWTNRAITVTCAWDRSPGTNTITNYTLWQGTNGVYTNSVFAGTNLSASVRIVPPPPRPIRVTFSGTNLPSLVLTNPSGNLFIRGWSWRAGSGKYPTVLQGKTFNATSTWTTLAGPKTNTVLQTPESLRVKVKRETL